MSEQRDNQDEREGAEAPAVENAGDATPAEGSAAPADTDGAPAPSADEVPAGFELPDLGGAPAAGAASGGQLDLLSDVDLNVKIELGRTRMLVEDVLRLGQGSVVELDKLAGDPVDVYVNERLVARGEVLVLNDNFCVRINELVSDRQAEGRRKSA